MEISKHIYIYKSDANRYMLRSFNRNIKIIDNVGDKMYLNESNLVSRDNGPAIIYKTHGITSYYIDNMLHRISGPAIVNEYNGYKEYWINNQLHNENGPAIVYLDGSKVIFYLYNVKYTEEEYYEKLTELKGNI